MNLKLRFTATLHKAQLEQKKIKQDNAKEREKLIQQNKLDRELARMAQKQFVKPDYGKKKMIRYNVPPVAKYEFKKKVDKKDYDLMKYLGDKIDFNSIVDTRD